MMWWHHGAWGAGDWLAMSLLMFVFWGGLVALAVWLVRTLAKDSDHTSRSALRKQRADDVLAERFARGEIDEDEFTRRRELLHAGSGRPPTQGDESR